MNRRRRLRLGCSIVVICAIICVFLFFPLVPPASPRDAIVYDVVIDAGSTGSRVHVFEYQRTATKHLILLSEFYKRVEPGLSSFADNLPGLAYSLKDLLQRAVHVIPPAQVPHTVVTLKATAGLRLLEGEQQKLILSEVKRILDESPLQSAGASIITGSEEGTLAWISVNYLLGNFARRHTASRWAATIDMGGASSQLVFRLDASVAWLPPGYTSTIHTGSDSLLLYHHSYLGLGMNEARKSMKSGTLLAQACHIRNESSSSSSPRVFESVKQEVERAVLSPSKCNHPTCGARGIPQPPIGTAHDVYAFSYFFDVLSRLDLLSVVRDVASLKSAAVSVCRSASTCTSCEDITYLYTYLAAGLGLGSETALHIPNRLQGKSVSWALGASLLHMQSWSIA